MISAIFRHLLKVSQFIIFAMQFSENPAKIFLPHVRYFNVKVVGMNQKYLGPLKDPPAGLWDPKKADAR